MGIRANSFDPDIENVRLSDLIGMWEETIPPGKDETGRYPGESQESQRITLYFLSDQIFYYKKGETAYQGKWELTEIRQKGQKRFKIVVNETYGYDIEGIESNRLCLSDGVRKYKLNRKH